VAVVGPGGSYIAQGLIYVFSTVWTVQLHVPARAAADRAPTGSLFSNTVEGWRYIRGHPEIRAGLTTLMVVALTGQSFSTLLPAVARDVLLVGAEGQGLLTAGLGLGALVSGVILATVGDQLPKGKIMIAGGLLYGVLELAFGYSSWFAASF